MVSDNLLLHFLPRSLQLNMSKNNNTLKSSGGVSNPSPTDSKRKEEEDPHAIEAHYSYKKMKKKKSKDYTEISQQANKHSAGFHQLEDLIAGFLSSRGLSNTLSAFLSETQHEFTRNTQKVKLEDMYHYYRNQIHESPRKENSEEGKVNRENTFGKPDVNARMIEESRKKKDNKGKSRKNGNAHMANHLIKNSNGFSEAKTHGSEIDFCRSEKSKNSRMKAVDDFSGHRKNTEKANKNLEPVIRTHKGIFKISNASNKLEQIFDYAEPLYKSKKSKGEKKRKKAASDEMNVIDNDKQNGGKKSKKVTTLEKEVQPMQYHALHGEAKKGRTADLRQDLENTTNIEVSKKEKKKKKKKIADTTPGDDGELGDTCVEITMALRESQATGSNTGKRESDIESVEDLSEDPSTSPNLKVSKEEMKKSSQTALAYKTKKNKKEEKAMKKLQVTFSHVINGGAKGVEGSLSQDTGNTQSITLAHKDFETNRSLIGESESLEKSSTDTISQSRSMPGKEDDAIETKGHISRKTKEYKQKKSETPTTESAFRRVRVEEVNFVDPMLGDNSYWAKDGAENGYGAKAQQVLGQVRGKGFRHEKTKKKRGSYTGGTIDLQSHSIKFSYSDNDE